MAVTTLSREAGLTYPFATPPEAGEAAEVVPGVLWIRLPMPLALDHINVWAMEDGDGFTLVDTGLFTAETPRCWREISNRFLSGRPIKRVIVTHAHEDHVGAAGWFAQEYGSALWITEDEYQDAQSTFSRRDQAPPDDYLQFYRAAGLTDAALDECRVAYGRSGRWMFPLPDKYQPLADGDEFSVGHRRWKVITGSGHSRKHACLYCPALELLISGDQVLPRISSNVSVRYNDRRDDPLSRWLGSLSKLYAAVPDSALVLPAHNDCFFGLHARLERLRKGHDAALERLVAALETPKSIVEMFATLFRREITGGTTLRLAVGETMANVNYLRRNGAISCIVGSDGINRYVREIDNVSAQLTTAP